MRRPPPLRNWLLVAVFAVGMAWVEASCVYYLRTLVDRVEPYQPDPLPVHEVLGPVELVREAATLVMLLTVGGIAGRTRVTRLGYAAIAFGIWDIFYYVFLKIISGWPTSLLDWDILFLIPLPWWGPVIAPISIAVLLIVWGTMATQDIVRDKGAAVTSTWWSVTAVGTALATTLGTTLALYVFMADAFHASATGNAPRDVLPTTFDWPLFVVAVTLMAAPIAQLAWGITGRRYR